MFTEPVLDMGIVLSLSFDPPFTVVKGTEM